MIENEFKKIEEFVQQGTFSKKKLHKLISKATELFVNKNDGYNFLTNRRLETCVSVMTLWAIEGVLKEKSQVDSL